MSDYDRTANARYGAGVARSGVGAIDQGLRAYMIGVYNYMTLGLGITGVFALGAFKLGVVENEAGRIIGLTDFGNAIYVSPLRWVIVPSRCVVFFISARINAISVSTARNTVPLRRPDRPVDVGFCSSSYTGASIGQVFAPGGGGFRRAEPLRLHDQARSVGNGLLPGDGPVPG